ncbi:MAG: GGDEF domain-containing protein [Epsilonproteobacteria bacterium]|nr:GGDEF domain-containing protein [Campylobacterota bacterium]
MQKEDLQKVILNVLYYLKEELGRGSDSDLTLSEAIEHLKNSKSIFQNIDITQLTLEESLEHLNEKYKQLAKESIKSYKETNNNFQKIAKKHEKNLQDISNSASNETKHIDLDLIQSKFADIQEHMIHEITRANEQITLLTQKVRLLEEESNLDALTKVFNRRSMDLYLKKICQKAPFKNELHLLIIDIDDFKKINDTYGHIAGDKILIFITNLLKQLLRDGDKIFRYGGEEFVIVLNRVQTQGCLNVVKRILSQINSNKLIYKGDSIRVSVSIGSTQFKEGDTPDTLLSRADKALYKAKKTGKNRHVRYE